MLQVSLLLNEGAKPWTVNVHGMNALDLAIEGGHVETVKKIIKIKGPTWRRALLNRTADGATPMKRMVKKMPQNAVLAMDRCISDNGMRFDHPDYEVFYDYELCDNDLATHRLVALASCFRSRVGPHACACSWFRVARC